MAKLNQIEVNGTTYDLQDKSIFTGTKSEVDSAISNGTIKEGDIVNITDDAGENSGGGGSSNIIYLTQEAYDALPASKETDGVEYRITDANTSTTVARNIAYDNSESGIEATSVQDAIDKVSESLENENNESFNFGYLNGVRGFFTNPSRADDCFIPFKSSNLMSGYSTSSTATIDFGKGKTVNGFLMQSNYRGYECVAGYIKDFGKCVYGARDYAGSVPALSTVMTYNSSTGIVTLKDINGIGFYYVIW